jgi:plastocyanin
MSRIARLTAASAAALAALALAGPVAAQQQASTLNGTVGPGFTIALAKSGKKVTKLAPGSYTIVVNDKAGAHNFHLSGPGVNKVITSVPFVGTKSVTVTLKKGTYKFVCDPHASMMKGSFTVA